MARKPRETMRQRQMRLRRMQQAMKGSSKQLPPGKKGGSIVKSGSASPENPRRTKARFKSAASAKGRTGSSTRVAGGSGLPKTPKALPPKGGSASNLMKNLKAGKNIGGKGLGTLGLIFSGAATAQDLANSLKKGEGYARLPKHIAEALKGNKDKKPAKKVGQGSRNRKKPAATKPSASRKIPTTAVTKTIKKSRDYQAEAKVAPKAKPVPKVNPAPKTTPAPKAKSRMEGASSGDRVAAWAKANRKMIEKSGTKKQKEILANALKKKEEKKKQSAATKAGWQGNKNY